MTEQKILYLHIGMPKTGTSSLQSFLVQNENALLQNNFCYPKMPGRYPMVSPNRNAHFLVGKVKNAAGVEDETLTKERFDLSIQRLEEAFQKADNVILSDEAIWNTYTVKTPECIRQIVGFCDERNIELKVIVYLRRQDYYLESYWKQQIRKRGAVWEWQRVIKKTPGYIVLDYEKHLREIAEEVGDDHMIVQAYQEENFDLCSDFMHILNIDDLDSFYVLEEKVNRSLNNNYAEIKRILNQLLETENMQEWGKQQRWFEKVAVDCSRADKKQYESSMFSAGQREDFVKKYDGSNHRISEKYMQGRELFDQKTESGSGLPQWSKDNALQYEDTVLFFGMAYLETKKELEALKSNIQRIEAVQRRGLLHRIADKCKMFL